MSKTAKKLLLLLAALFFFIGIMSYLNSKTFAELTNVQTISGIISKLHCPPKGAAALSLSGSDITYNLSIKFRTKYCNAKHPPVLLGKKVSMESIHVNGNFHQVYQIKENEHVILDPNDVESDQNSSTLGLFFLSFLLTTRISVASATH